MREKKSIKEAVDAMETLGAALTRGEIQFLGVVTKGPNGVSTIVALQGIVGPDDVVEMQKGIQLALLRREVVGRGPGGLSL